MGRFLSPSLACFLQDDFHHCSTDFPDCWPVWKGLGLSCRSELWALFSPFLWKKSMCVCWGGGMGNNLVYPHKPPAKCFCGHPSL